MPMPAIAANQQSSATHRLPRTLNGGRHETGAVDRDEQREGDRESRASRRGARGPLASPLARWRGGALARARLVASNDSPASSIATRMKLDQGGHVAGFVRHARSPHRPPGRRRGWSRPRNTPAAWSDRPEPAPPASGRAIIASVEGGALMPITVKSVARLLLRDAPAGAAGERQGRRGRRRWRSRRRSADRNSGWKAHRAGHDHRPGPIVRATRQHHQQERLPADARTTCRRG